MYPILEIKWKTSSMKAMITLIPQEKPAVVGIVRPDSGVGDCNMDFIFYLHTYQTLVHGPASEISGVFEC